MYLTKAVCVSTLVCLLGFAAKADVVYLSNLANSNTVALQVLPGDPLAQRFQSGHEPGGYLFDSVMLDVSRGTGATGTIAVVLRANSATNSPGAALATLTGATPTGGSTNFTNLVYSAASGIVLQRDTTYWISVECATDGSFFWRSAGTNYAVSVSQDGWAFLPNGSFNGSTHSNRPLYAEFRCKDPIRYFQDFSGAAIGATTAGDGSTLSSTSIGTAAEVQDAGFQSLQLTTSGVANTRSAFLLPDLDPGLAVNAFSAKWQAEIYGNFPSAGEGWSVSFGQLGLLPLTATNYDQESGYGVGLTLSVETATNNPGFYLLLNGATIASSPFTSATQWGVNSNTLHYFEWDWHYSDGITVRLDGQSIFSGVTTYGFIPQPGDRFVWAARTGTSSERVRIDNVLVATGGNLKRESVSSPYVNSPGSLSASIAFDGVFSLGTVWSDFSPPTGFVGGTISTAKTIRAFAVTSGGAARSADPRLWSLEGSSDGGSNFTTCVATGGTFRGGVMTLCTPSTNAESYNVFRLNISTNAGSSVSINVSEFSLYSFAPAAFPAAWNFVTGTTNTTPYGTTISIAKDDGRMLAGFFYDNLYRAVSNDAVWTSVSGTQTDLWTCVRIAGNGQYQYAVKYPAIYRSANFGTSFSQVYGVAVSWDELAVSDSGAVLLAANRSGASYLNYSTDYGVSWPVAASAKVQYWSGVAVSADGTRLVATSDRGTNSSLPGNIWISTNSGVTWTQTTAPSQRWQTVTMSDDGMRIYAAATNSPHAAVIYLSTNGGTSWQLSSAPTRGYAQLVCSMDGQTIAARSTSSNSIALSRDYGQTWSTLQPEGAVSFSEIAISGDGAHLAAINGSGIYNYRFQFQPPTVTDVSPFAYASSAVFLRSFINPRGWDSTAWVAFGPSPDFGQTNTVNVGSGNSDVSFNPVLTNLNSGTTYYYQFFATNRTGVVRSGALHAFETPSAVPANLQVSLSGSQLTGNLGGSFYDINYIQYSPSMSPPAWQTIATNYNGTSASSPLTLNLTGSNGFYRSISK